jgi:drug/metabolite transporter (DMT)-like permease
VSRKDRLDGLAVFLLLGCCASWGLNQVAIKAAMPAIPPVLQAGLRSALAAVLLALWCSARGEPVVRRDGTGRWGLLVGLMFAVEFVLFYWGLAFTTATRAVIFLYTAPLFVAVGAHYLIPGEGLTRVKAAGLGLAFGGLCLAFVDGLYLPSRREMLGDLLELGAAFLWGATTILIKRTIDARLTPQRTLLYQLGVSGVLLLATAWVMGESLGSPVPARVWLALAYQTVVIAFASYLAWFWLLAHYPASAVSALTFWTPIFGVLAGVLLLGEPFSTRLLGAVALVAAGIFLVNRPSAKHDRSP